MRRSLVVGLSAVLVLGGVAQVPTFAGTSSGPAGGSQVVPATVTAGTAALYTSDNCGADPAPPGQGAWIWALDLTLALRVHGHQRTMSIGSPWVSPPSWPDYSGGDRSVPCGDRTLPTMSFVGTTTAAESGASEPVHGYCWSNRGLLGRSHLSCKLSIHGRSPFRLEMTLTDVYDSYESEHSAGEDVNSTFVVTGAQPRGSS